MFKLILIIIFFTGKSANAYFDPGSGAFIVQTIIASISVIAIYLGYPIRYVKKLILKLINILKKTKTSGQDKR